MSNITQTKINYPQFFLRWLTMSTVYLVTMGGLMDTVPSRLDWISTFVFPAGIVVGLIGSLIAVKQQKATDTTKDTLLKDGVITLVSTAVLIVLYFISIVTTPNIYVTESKLTSLLDKIGLNVTQITQIEQIISSKGYISSDDLDSISLNEVQKKEVLTILDGAGFVNESEVIIIMATQDALIATQTAIANTFLCHIEAETGYNTISIRSSPSSDSNPIGYLVSGERLLVIGHDGKRINQDRWWLVEYGHDENSIKCGWIASWLVKEINEVECIQISPALGY